jgi:hypothetical protein
MGFVPAICNKCGHLFNSNFVGGGSGTIIGCGVGCPRCGGPAWIPDGKYTISEEKTVIESLDGTKINAVFTLLMSAVSENWEHERVKDELISLNTGLEKYIPRDSQSLASWVRTILVALALLVGRGEQKPPVVINNYTNNLPVQNTSDVTKPLDHKGISRNQACPCGSGKKYKKCCGAPRQGTAR